MFLGKRFGIVLLFEQAFEHDATSIGIEVGRLNGCRLLEATLRGEASARNQLCSLSLVLQLQIATDGSRF